MFNKSEAHYKCATRSLARRLFICRKKKQQEKMLILSHKYSLTVLLLKLILKIKCDNHWCSKKRKIGINGTYKNISWDRKTLVILVYRIKKNCLRHFSKIKPTLTNYFSSLKPSLCIVRPAIFNIALLSALPSKTLVLLALSPFS